MRITAGMLADRLGDRLVETRGLDGAAADASSVRILAYDAHRLEAGRATVVPASRTEGLDADPGAIAIVEAPFPTVLPCPALVCRGGPEALLEAALAAFEDVRRLEEDLVDGLLQEREAAWFVEILSRFTGNLVELIDPSLQIVARVNPVAGPDGSVSPRVETTDSAFTAATVSEMARSNLLRETFESRVAYLFRSPLFENEAVIRNLHRREEFLGQIVLIGSRRPLGRGSADLLDRVARHFEHVLLRHRASLNASLQPVEYFVSEMLRGRIADRGFMETQLAARAWVLSDPCVLVFVRTPAADSTGYYAYCLGGLLPRAMVFAFEDGVVAIVRSADLAEDEIARRLAPFLAEAGLCAGVSETFADFLESAVHLVQARDAAAFADPDGAGGDDARHLVRYRDVAIDHLVAAAVAQDRGEAFLHPAIRRLEALGRSGDELLATLEAFLDLGGSHASTAARLHIHRNTLKYRLRRIQEVAGVDLEAPQERLRLHLSFRTRRVRAPSGSGSSAFPLG